MDRRTFLKVTGSGMLVIGTGIGFASCTPPLQPADANGLRLLPGFSSRKIATSGQPVGPTTFKWHGNPDGGAVFPMADGGWVYTSNCEGAPGGASMVRFSADGDIVGASSILGGTLANCAGGATPWGTWLSCEEWSGGQVHECYLNGDPADARPAMGKFKHEAAAVDPIDEVIYLTEDEPDGAFYRFRPEHWEDLSEGVLEVMTEVGGVLAWSTVPDPTASAGPTRKQVTGTKRFAGGEGTVFVNCAVHFTTKGDNRVWRYTPATNVLTVLYDDDSSTDPVLTGVDNITALPSGDLFVAEDPGDLQIVRIRPNGSVEPLLQLTGVTGTEITGPAFTPDGARLYFSSQRNPGVTFEVIGPF